MRRSRRNKLDKGSILLVLIILLFFTPALAEDLLRVKRVIDGDTLLLTKGEKVRLIGVDTPETKHPQKPVERFGKEAYLFTKRMVEGKEVRLEFDWQKRDKYGRLLAYVYLMDGTFLNAEIIKQGYGFAYTRFPFRYLEDFRVYEREARDKRAGLWKE
jgi:micrococcal nuclease